MLKIALTHIALFCFGVVFSQDGTRVYEFLNLTTSPRQAALGGNTQSAWDSDPNMSYWNPALMNPEMNNKAAINYVNYLTDVSYSTASYVRGVGASNYASIHLQYVDYGDFVAADEIGNVTGDFQAKDMAVVMGFAHNLNDFFTVGVNGKYVNSRIENYTSSAVAADLGVVFHDIDYDTNVGFNIRNVGFQLKPYEDKKENLPVQVNLGISHLLEHVPIELSATLHDLQKFDISEQYTEQGLKTSVFRKAIDHVSVGAEFFPRSGFNLRVGYNFKRGNDLTVDNKRNFSGLSFGFGIRVSSFRFEYSNAKYHSSSNTQFFGLRIDFEDFLQPRYF